MIKVAYLKAHQILKILKTNNLKTLIFAYKVYVRPHLEYAVESWQPKLKKDVLRLEKVQRYYTSVVSRICDRSVVPSCINVYPFVCPYACLRGLSLYGMHINTEPSAVRSESYQRQMGV